jgi:hypothetical protein
MQFCAWIRLPALGALAVVGPFKDNESTEEWIAENVGDGASATPAILWDPETAPRFG